MREEEEDYNNDYNREEDKRKEDREEEREKKRKRNGNNVVMKEGEREYYNKLVVREGGTLVQPPGDISFRQYPPSQVLVPRKTHVQHNKFWRRNSHIAIATSLSV